VSQLHVHFRHREARPLIYHLASQGWTCISANYRLATTPADGFPAHLIDAKKVIAWVRTHGREHGADPGTTFLVGGSAGVHIAAMAALTANDPRFQPGFEAVDTSITAGVGLYGYYGSLGEEQQPPTTPLAYARADAPPFFVIHGENDTFTPVERPRALVENLRQTSYNPVVYAELPGAQHSFDLFHSVRFETMIDAIEMFAAWVRSQNRPHTLSKPSRRSTPAPRNHSERLHVRDARAQPAARGSRRT
jgi:acetyl esterase/lipase